VTALANPHSSPAARTPKRAVYGPFCFHVYSQPLHKLSTLWRCARDGIGVIKGWTRAKKIALVNSLNLQ
jgi:hypothetical protein